MRLHAWRPPSPASRKQRERREHDDETSGARSEDGRSAEPDRLSRTVPVAGPAAREAAPRRRLRPHEDRHQPDDATPRYGLVDAALALARGRIRLRARGRG